MAIRAPICVDMLTQVQCGPMRPAGGELLCKHSDFKDEMRSSYLQRMGIESKTQAIQVMQR